MLNLQIQVDNEREGEQLASRIIKKNTCLIEVGLLIQELERYKLMLLDIEFEDTREGFVENENET